MLKKIKVYGTLRKFLGQAEFEVDLNTPREAISFLVCNFKGIEEHMADQIYMIQVGAKVITEDLINLNTQDDIKIIPIEIVDEVLKIALTKEFKKVEWTEIDNVSGSKTEDKSQAIIQ